MFKTPQEFQFMSIFYHPTIFFLLTYLFLIYHIYLSLTNALLQETVLLYSLAQVCQTQRPAWDK